VLFFVQLIIKMSFLSFLDREELYTQIYLQY
jgi:hypothetical protein